MLVLTVWFSHDKITIRSQSPSLGAELVTSHAPLGSRLRPDVGLQPRIYKHLKWLIEYILLDISAYSVANKPSIALQIYGFFKNLYKGLINCSNLKKKLRKFRACECSVAKAALQAEFQYTVYSKSYCRSPAKMETKSTVLCRNLP